MIKFIERLVTVFEFSFKSCDYKDKTVKKKNERIEIILKDKLQLVTQFTTGANL